MADAGALPDPDELIRRRERRALRLVGVTATGASTVAIVAWLMGPCWAAMVWPWVATGGGLLGMFAALIAASAIGIWVLAAKLRRQRRGDHAGLGRTCGQMALATLPMALPGLCWWPFLIWFVARGSSFWGEEARAAIGTAIISFPAIPCVSGAIAWWRYRRVYPTIPDGEAVPPSPWWRDAGLAGFAVLLVVALLWPGGPRAVGADAVVDGATVDEWAVRWASVDEERAAERALAKAGDAAVPAIVAQWPVPSGFRETLAGWLGTNFGMAAVIAPAFDRMRIGVRGGDELLDSIGRMGPAVGGVAPAVAAFGEVERTLPHAPSVVECLARLGPRAIGPLLELEPRGVYVLTVLDAAARVEPYPGASVDATVLATLERRMPQEETPNARVKIARVLALHGSPAQLAVALELIGPGLTSTNSQCRYQAVIACAAIGDLARPLAPGLRAVFDRTITDRSRQISARDSLIALAGAETDTAALATRVAAAAASTDPLTRVAAAYAAGLAGPDAAGLVDAVLPLLKDTDVNVRFAALVGIAHATGSVRGAEALIRRSLKVPSTIDIFLVADRLSALGPLAKDAIPVLKRIRAERDTPPGLMPTVDSTIRALEGEELPAYRADEAIRTRAELHRWLLANFVGQ